MHKGMHRGATALAASPLPQRNVLCRPLPSVPTTTLTQKG